MHFQGSFLSLFSLYYTWPLTSRHVNECQWFSPHSHMINISWCTLVCSVLSDDRTTGVTSSSKSHKDQTTAESFKWSSEQVSRFLSLLLVWWYKSLQMIYQVVLMLVHFLKCFQFDVAFINSVIPLFYKLVVKNSVLDTHTCWFQLWMKRYKVIISYVSFIIMNYLN